MVLFEVHEVFKGHFFNELRVSFNAMTRFCEWCSCLFQTMFNQRKIHLLFEFKVFFTFIWSFNGTILKARKFETERKQWFLHKESHLLNNYYIVQSLNTTSHFIWMDWFCFRILYPIIIHSLVTRWVFDLFIWS